MAIFFLFCLREETVSPSEDNAALVNSTEINCEELFISSVLVGLICRLGESN